jgi:hypothetical protein
MWHFKMQEGRKSENSGKSCHYGLDITWTPFKIDVLNAYFPAGEASYWEVIGL